MVHLDDTKVRLAAFAWLNTQVELHGDVLPRTLLAHGFELDGQRIPLLSPQGIFKPKVLPEIPLTITTTPSGPYADRMGPEGLILYSYRGTDPHHGDNVGLRKAMKQGKPLAYFHGIVQGKYMVICPVYIVGDDLNSLMFKVAVDDPSQIKLSLINGFKESVAESSSEGRRLYITSEVKVRLHQRAFRERVLAAYKEKCALCRLRHSELLDAAHIIPDGEPGGDPVVNNGLALCKLHHAAFDKFFLAIRPDYIIQIRKDVLKEEDGPMLLHGLQGLHGKQIHLPGSSKALPSPDRLERRYERFLSVV